MIKRSQHHQLAVSCLQGKKKSSDLKTSSERGLRFTWPRFLLERCSQLFLCINVSPKKSLRAPATRGLKKEMGTDLWLMCVCVCSQWKKVMCRRSVNEKPAQAWCHKFLGKKCASLAWHLESISYFQWGFAGLRYQALLLVFKTHLILDEHWFTLWNPIVRQAAICPSSWRNRSQQYSLPSLGNVGQGPDLI